VRTRLLAVTVAFVALAACGDDDAPPGATSIPNPSTTVLPGETPSPDGESIALTVGEQVDFPQDLAIIIATGCWQCDGPTDSIVRLRRTPQQIEERTLFDDIPAGGSITGLAFDVDTGRAAVSTCAPNCTGLGEITGTEATVVHLSTDNGASFAASPPADGWFSLRGYAGDDLLISGPFGTDDEPNAVRVYDTDVAVPRPPEGDAVVTTPDGPLWMNRAQNTLFTPDGTVVFTTADDTISMVSSLDPGARLAVLLYRPEGESANYQLLIGRRNDDALEHERTLTGGFIYAGARLDNCTLLANAELPAGTFPTPGTGGGFFVGMLPSVIDVCEGVIHPIVDPFTRAPYLNGRNLIQAVQRGPFLAVADDIGDCLNVRETPSTDAPTLGCFGAGVLLRDLGELSDAAGQGQPDRQTWRRVATPAGDEGWASDGFLTP
jgi:hypothetical protein